MTITQPTGELFTDIAIFAAFTAVALAGVWIDGARRIKRGRWD